MNIFFNNFRIIDAGGERRGSVLCKDGLIASIYENSAADTKDNADGVVINGHGRLALMPGFIDMHAHFRAPGFPDKETIESASLAAVHGGWTTVVCMANTQPVIDNIDLASAVRNRAHELALIDLYPVLSLTKGMEGSAAVPNSDDIFAVPGSYRPLMFSEDGKDVTDDGVFFKALRGAALCGADGAGIPVSCHCDLGGEAEATRRAIELGCKAGAHVHIAHVSLAESCEAVRQAKTTQAAISAEATPHHISLIDADAANLGDESHGKVAPPLRSEADRRAVIEALRDGTIDVVATDHAPHTFKAKEDGAPGFAGLETAFSVVNTVLVKNEDFSLSDVSRFLSAAPAKILKLADRGLLSTGLRADLCVVEPEQEIVVGTNFASRGKNSPYIGKTYKGKVIMTVFEGRMVFCAP